MIPYIRDPQQTIPSSAVKIIGLGGAGSNVLEKIALDGLEDAELMATNTDARALSACLAREKIQLGNRLTRGLGTGGDPGLGQQAVLEAEDEIRNSIRGRRIIFLCVGLGGGTGSGGAPIITRIAREEGAFVVVFATMPFAFEGQRRREQAEAALNELAVLSNALVTFDNNRMGELVLAKQGIHEAFVAADHMIGESIKAVMRLVVRPGLINVGLDELVSALRTNRSRCLFGSGIASGKDRAVKALKNALNSPLLDQGALLKSAETVLVHLSGGKDLTLFEIELLMQRLRKFVPESAHILFGAAIDPVMGDSLSITLISALPEDFLATAPRDSLSQAPQENPIFDSVPEFPSQPLVAAEPAAHAEEREDEIPSEDESMTEPTSDALSTPEGAEIYQDSNESIRLDEVPEFVTEEPGQTAPERNIAAFTFIEDTLPGELAEDQPTAVSAPRSETGEEGATDHELARDREAVGSFETVGSLPQAPEFSHPPTPDSEPPKLKLGMKSPGLQTELSLDSVNRGRFEGETPNVFEGEDLDLPPFLRKKK